MPIFIFTGVPLTGADEVLARKLHFPAYFGHNWDALDECLRYLSWNGPQGRIVIVHEGLPFAPTSPAISTLPT